MKQRFDVTGMTCSACSAHVEKSVSKVEGVQEVQVNLLNNSMNVTFLEDKTNENAIIQAVVDSGYGANVYHAKKEPAKQNTAQEELKGMRYRMLVSFIFLIPLMYISMGHMLGLPLPHIFHGTENALTFAFTQLLLTLPVMYVNRKYYINGFKTLIRRSPNMDSLIAIGSMAAVVYGVYAIYNIGYGLGHGMPELVNSYLMDLYFESAAMILALITFGKYLEARSKGKTSEAIEKLIHLAPKTAVVERDGQEITVEASEVMIGDVVIVKAGESIAVDGEIVEGNGAVDESAITGESIPVEKQAGDKVVGATVNKSGYFKFRAEKVGDDTTLSQIIRLVEEASASKAPIAKLADKVSGVFVPIVICIAVAATIIWLILGYGFSFALSIGISVLVISCPCALGLATPTAIMVGTGKGAENGILIKSAESLEIAHEVQTVVMDKTGTITEGRPEVTDILSEERDKLLSVAFSVERLSEHPLAQAIVRYSQDNARLDTRDFEQIAGRGIRAIVDGEPVLAGNRKMMEENQINTNAYTERADRFAEEGKTVLYFSMGQRLLGIIAVADVIKPTSKQAVEELEHMGLEVVMLTGDNRKTAAAIQKQLGISRVIAEVLPNDKEREIRKIAESGRKVAMIGDGINDAPALARADVGIAIGAGTDVAIESADIVLMKSDLMDAVSAIQLSRAVIRNIKENLFWAFFYNVIGIPVAAGVFYHWLNWRLNPMLGAAAMSLSSVFVVSNALRLKFFKTTYHTEKKEEEKIMTKTIQIEGMSCGHCSARVEKALNAISGVQAVVDLDKKTAAVTLTDAVSDETLKNAVTEAGYEVISIA